MSRFTIPDIIERETKRTLLGKELVVQYEPYENSVDLSIDVLKEFLINAATLGAGSINILIGHDCQGDIDDVSFQAVKVELEPQEDYLVRVAANLRKMNDSKKVELASERAMYERLKKKFEDDK